ncbi:hypothetical protein B296_00043218 [Ensete ventricosum]|uniref:Uncharacterized protein n=1 Tax=Ensete ventricosum TaxID=4639 RepID=A0A426XY90_ENSVE|nr:hypothetical protein B296_00043218 [Ensete ventricosum]
MGGGGRQLRSGVPLAHVRLRRAAGQGGRAGGSRTRRDARVGRHVGGRRGCSGVERRSHMRPVFKRAEQTFAGPGPCALDRPPRSLLGTEWELARMSDDSELGLEGQLLEWWSPGEEGVIQLGSTANSCKEVRSGRFPT